MTTKKFAEMKAGAVKGKGKAVAILPTCDEAELYARAAESLKEYEAYEKQAKEALLAAMEVPAAVAVGAKIQDGFDTSTAEIETDNGKVTLTYKAMEAELTGEAGEFAPYVEERVSLELTEEASNDKTIRKIIDLLGEDNFKKWFSMSVNHVARVELSKDRLLSESTYTKAKQNFKYHKPSVSFKAAK